MLVAVPLAIAALFLPAGSWRFWQGWVFLSIFLSGTAFTTLYLYRHDPALLERRLAQKEPAREQKLFRIFWIPLWVVVITLPGLDHRLGWSRVPPWLTLFSAAAVVGSYVAVLVVMKVNTFASAVIQVEAGQKVISTGPYRVVRHPMYSGFLMMILAAPLTLGSYVALAPAVLLIPVLIYRLIHEEKTLRQELPGYAEYCQRTRFRLVPFIY